MEDYIRVYENVISSNWCDALIEKFEDFDDQHEVLDDKMSFIQINFAKNVLSLSRKVKRGLGSKPSNSLPGS